MIAIFYTQLVVPVILLIVQTYLLFMAAIFVMKRTQMMRVSLDDLEISQVITISAILFCVFYISSANFGPYLQSYKVSVDEAGVTWQQTIGKFGRYFLHVVGAEIVFAMLALLNIRLLTGFKKVDRQVAEGNIGVSIVVSVIMLSFAILTRFVLLEILDYITPRPIIFN